MKLNHTAEETTEQASLYALGALSQNEARAFQEHLEAGCEVCASEVALFEPVVTALGLAAAEAQPPARAREKLLMFLAPAANAPVADSTNRFFTLRANEGEWKEIMAGISIKQLFVDEKNDTVTSLFKFAPGASLPVHQHEGIEQCLVLEGDFQLNGEIFTPGDFTCALPGSVHHTAHTENGALVLIVANATYTMSSQPTA